MSQTRAELDRKLTLLEARAHELSPRRLTARVTSGDGFDRLIGGALVGVGIALAVAGYRAHRHRRRRLHAELAQYECW